MRSLVLKRMLKRLKRCLFRNSPPAFGQRVRGPYRHYRQAMRRLKRRNR